VDEGGAEVVEPRSGGEVAAVLIAACLLLLAGAAPAHAGHDKTDVVTTDDGGLYIGEIKHVQYATLTLDTDPAGLIDIEWRHVRSLESKFEYRVEVTGGREHFGSLGAPGETGRLVILTATEPLDVALDEVVSIVPVEQGFWKALDGSISFGLTFTQASETLQYNLSGDAERRTRKRYSTLTGQSIFNAQRDAEDSSQHYLKFLMSRFTKSRWGPFVMGQLQSNPDQGYDLRYLIGGGASNFLVENSRELFALNLGLVYNREDVAGEAETDESGEALAGVAYRRFKRGSHSPSIQLSLMTFTTLDDTHRFRGVLDFNVSWKIVGDFKFSCQINNSYDSEPPGTDAKKNDLTLVTSVGFTF
jgi:hypothetical protein